MSLIMLKYIVGCEYIEYDNNGQFVCENEDPWAGEFTTIEDAEAYATELIAEPDIFKVYIQTSPS